MIDEVFGATGILSQKFAGYAPRAGQVDMARMIDASITEKTHACVEGPTGTGKSLAYLVPAIDHVTRPIPTGVRPPLDNRVIVVTANIALQEQLVTKDLPLLRDILGKEFTFALSKGKNNYLCIAELGKVLAETATNGTRGDRTLDRVLAWAQETKTGDANELEETPAPALWRKLSVASDECKGKACKWFDRCFAEQASRKVARANVVVTNYHMFFAHLAVRAKMRQLAESGTPVDPDVVLPPARIVIFDEAHKAAEIARDFLGFQISKGTIDWLVRGFNHELAEETKKVSDAFFAALLAHKQSGAYRARLRRGHPLGELGSELEALLRRVARFYKEAVSTREAQDEKAELELRSRRGYTLAEQVSEAMVLSGDGEIVYFIEESGGGDDGRRARSAILKSKPIEVSDFLRRELFAQYKTVVLTSATLATSSGPDAFSYVKKEVGLDTAKELVADSPFAWKDQVLLVLPPSMPDPSTQREAYPSAVASHVREVCEAAGGRTLGLFTSYKVLEETWRACVSLPFRILKQKEAAPRQLVARFKEDVTSCLFGCESFWAGVDVPGEALSCVVIDRLPFPTPDDPIIDAISERDRNWFFNVAVPRAVIQMKQGFGRLIRTTTDRGCVVLLDPRLQTKGYGRTFLKALPPVQVSQNIESITKFLAKE